MENIEEHNPEKELEKLAAKRVKKIKDFYIHAFIYVIGFSIYILKTYFGFPLNFIPLKYINGFVMIFWGFSFAAHAIGIFCTEILFGRKWENQKVKKMMEEEKEKNKWE